MTTIFLRKPMPYSFVMPLFQSSLVFVIALACQILGYDSHLKLYDEGIILYGSERVLGGDIPYRDFWTMYGPGQFYLSAFLYKLFGVSDIVPRAIGIISKSLITSFSYYVITRFSPKINGAIAAFLILCLLMNVRNDCFPVFPAVAFVILSLLFFNAGLKNNRNNLLTAGILTGLATTFRHDIGAYNAIAVLLVLFVLANRTQQGYRLAIGQTALYFLGILVITIPVTALLVYNVSINDLYENLIEIPAKIYPKTRSLPFPGVNDLKINQSFDFSPFKLFQFSVYLPIVVAIWSIFVEVCYFQKQIKQSRSIPNDNNPLIPLLIVTNLLFILKGLVRVSTIMMVQSSILSIMLVAIGAARINWKSTIQRLSTLAIISVTAIVLIFPVQESRWRIMAGLETLVNGSSELVERCKNPIMSRLQCVTADSDYLATAKFIKENSQENDVIYVGTTRHDRIFANAVALYFMAERRSVTKWHELHPGIQTTGRIQNIIIEEMRQTPPRYVILDSRWDDIEEPNDSKLSSGVTTLDDYIQANFEETKRIGTIHIMSPGLPNNSGP